MSFDSAEQAVSDLRKAFEQLASAMPAVKKQLVDGEGAAAKLRDVEDELRGALDKLDSSTRSLGTIEEALLGCLDAARDCAFDGSLAVATREKMTQLCQTAFSKLEKAGFRVMIPAPGDPLDTRLHNPTGKAKSEFGATQVADVVAWGYAFPSGNSRLAEVLVGDGSLVERPADQPTAAPEPKAGIAMVLEDAVDAPKRKKKTSDTLFDRLSQAAERNQDP